MLKNTLSSSLGVNKFVELHCFVCPTARSPSDFWASAQSVKKPSCTASISTSDAGVGEPGFRTVTDVTVRRRTPSHGWLGWVPKEYLLLAMDGLHSGLLPAAASLLFAPAAIRHCSPVASGGLPLRFLPAAPFLPAPMTHVPVRLISYPRIIARSLPAPSWYPSINSESRADLGNLTQ